MVRLQKYLAECGVASRRACEKLIASGEVTINGEVAILGCSVRPGDDIVTIGGKEVTKNCKEYVVLHKPANCITTANDTHGRKTVMDYLDGLEIRVYPVGRLDQDVNGVLLLTNDGELAHRLLHPSYNVEKTYLAWVWGRVGTKALDQLTNGVQLDDGITAPATVTILKRDAKATFVRLILREGRKREVKRMLDAVGHHVKSLTRVSFAKLEVRDLRPGEWRHLTDSEVAELKELVGLSLS